MRKRRPAQSVSGFMGCKVPHLDVFVQDLTAEKVSDRLESEAVVVSFSRLRDLVRHSEHTLVGLKLMRKWAAQVSGRKVHIM